MNIKIATQADQQGWDEYVWNHPDAVAYHQFAWGQAVKKAYKFDSEYLIAEEQGTIVGILPFIRLKIPLLGTQLVSLPYCDLGGVLADDDETAKALCDYAVANYSNAKCVELRQSAEQNEGLSAAKVRMVLTLPDSAEALMSGFKAKLRSQVRKPTKDGLTSELGGIELIDEFYSVMTVNMRDLGSPVHSKRWFEQVVSQYGKNSRVGIVRCPQGRAIGAGIILLHRDSVSIPWASTLREFNRMNPNMLLYWTFLSYAADNGYKAFDFGRSTPGEGTYKFKAQWGAQEVPLLWSELLRDGGDTSVSGPSALRERVEQLWRTLPLNLTTAIGSLLRRYISL